MRNGNRKADVVITGGGASGLAAAVELGMRAPGLDVLVIEKMPEPGRKIRATGSGRCNISNTAAEGYSEIMKFFARIGLMTRTYENGLVYPYSESAADVADLLVRRAASLGVRFACGEEVTEMQRDEGGFLVSSVYKDEKGPGGWLTEAKYLILASGGKAGPSFGTTGDGYRLARKLGHSIVTPVPALTGIECAEWDEFSPSDAHVLAGTRTAGVVSLYRSIFPELPCYEGPFFRGGYSNMKPVFIERGEIQFTKYGLSGICVFNMTRHMRLNRAEAESFSDFFIKTDLFPDGNISDYIFDLQKGPFSGMPLREMLCTVLKEPLAGYVVSVMEDSGGISGAKPVSQLNFGDISFICEVVHGLEFYPEGLRGWKDAQVTMGGVPVGEIDPSTSESKLVRGLYITGELADRDFQCGGFNLSNAWLTGMRAAEDISGRLQR